MQSRVPGQAHGRQLPGGGHEVRLVEGNRHGRGLVGNLHLLDTLRAREICSAVSRNYPDMTGISWLKRRVNPQTSSVDQVYGNHEGIGAPRNHSVVTVAGIDMAKHPFWAACDVRVPPLRLIHRQDGPLPAIETRDFWLGTDTDTAPIRDLNKLETIWPWLNT